MHKNVTSKQEWFLLSIVSGFYLLLNFINGRWHCANRKKNIHGLYCRCANNKLVTSATQRILGFQLECAICAELSFNIVFVDCQHKGTVIHMAEYSATNLFGLSSGAAVMLWLGYASYAQGKYSKPMRFLTTRIPWKNKPITLTFLTFFPALLQNV